MEENAERVIEAVQEEWQKRLNLYQKGGYKADTPDQGVLKQLDIKLVTKVKIGRLYLYHT